MVRHKRNSFSDTGTSLPPALSRRVFFFPPRAPSISPVSPPGPETPCFFTGLWDFFHADRRVVHQRGLTVNLLSSLFHRYARTLARVPPRKREKEKERKSGERGGNNKKEQMPAAIKTTESIKNFRPFTAELPRRSTVGYMREKSTTTTTTTMHQDVSRR